MSAATDPVSVQGVLAICHESDVGEGATSANSRDKSHNDALNVVVKCAPDQITVACRYGLVRDANDDGHVGKGDQEKAHKVACQPGFGWVICVKQIGRQIFYILLRLCVHPDPHMHVEGRGHERAEHR